MIERVLIILVQTMWLTSDHTKDIDQQLNDFLMELKITRERLIDIKYKVLNCDGVFYTSALVIYDGA